MLDLSPDEKFYCSYRIRTSLDSWFGSLVWLLVLDPCFGYLVWILSLDPCQSLHWTSTGKGSKRVHLGKRSLVWIADPYRYGSSSSSVKGKPICAYIDMGPFGPVWIRACINPVLSTLKIPELATYVLLESLCV